MTTKLFGTDGIRGCVGEHPMVPELILRVGHAIAHVLGESSANPRILIGKDTRLSGYVFESALEAGCLAGGADVYLTGPLPTPAIAQLTRSLRLQAGIVVTASHNLSADNGVKVFGPDGHKLPDEAEVRIEVIVASELRIETMGKAHRVEDGIGRYVEFCKSTVPFSFVLPPSMSIVVDCANGAMYHVAPMVLRELGGNVTCIHDVPDGSNINASCGALHLETLVAAVRERGANVGMAFDGDGDRLVMVDGDGRVYNGDELLYIIAADLQRKDLLRGGVIGTLMSNAALEQALFKIAIPFHRSMVGDRYVLEELRRRDWQLGGESSGHIVMLDRHTTGDGLVAALKILTIMVERGASLKELAEPIRLFPQCTINVRGRATLSDGFQRRVDEMNGRLQGRGRILCRVSGTEPVTRVTVEHMEREKARELAEKFADHVQSEIGPI